MLNVVHVERLK